MNRLWVRLAVDYGLVLCVVVMALGIMLPFGSPADESVSEESVALLVEADYSPKEIEAIVLLTESGGLQRIFLERDLSGLRNLVTAILVAGLFLGLLVSYWLTRPLNRLVKATQSIGEQDLSKRVDIKGVYEIRTLGQSFNDMAEALQTAETRRQQLLADVAHELRTPLTVLQSNLRAILDDVYDADKAQMFTLYSQTRQLHHLVDDLHDLAQADAHQLPLDKTDIDMIALIEQAGELFEPLAQEGGIILHLSTPEQMPVVSGDRARLTQVLQNLLANGLRHAHSRVDLRLWQAGETACVEVADDGDGIAAEHLPYIFNRFYRVDPSRSREMGGSGLGLAIAQAIVKAHGGTITAVSDGPGQGTTVRFELPNAFTDEAPENLMSSTITTTTLTHPVNEASFEANDL